MRAITGCQGVEHSVELGSCHHQHHGCALAMRFDKHDAICDRDCCSCVSLSPVTATPQWFAFDTDACAVGASLRRYDTDDLP